MVSWTGVFSPRARGRDDSSADLTKVSPQFPVSPSNRKKSPACVSWSPSSIFASTNISGDIPILCPIPVAVSFSIAEKTLPISVFPISVPRSVSISFSIAAHKIISVIIPHSVPSSLSHLQMHLYLSLTFQFSTCFLCLYLHAHASPLTAHSEGLLQWPSLAKVCFGVGLSGGTGVYSTSTQRGRGR